MVNALLMEIEMICEHYKFGWTKEIEEEESRTITRSFCRGCGAPGEYSIQEVNAKDQRRKEYLKLKEEFGDE